LLLDFELLQKFLAQRAVAPRGQPQDFATNVWRQINGKPAAGHSFLLADLLLEFQIAFYVGSFSRLPSLAEECATPFGVDLPERISDSRQRSSTECWVAKVSRIAG
jgi:hypothetical protein